MDRFIAHGLLIESAFHLPGVRSSDAQPQSPDLRLTTCSELEIHAQWSGCSRAPEWQGIQGDGELLTLERGNAGDALFSYGKHARFHLDAKMTQLAVATPRDQPGWQRVLLGKIIPAISVMRGYEALHAAAVHAPAGVVAIMAPSGTGKSTLTAALLSRGWHLFADDQLTLSRSAGRVLAHPGTRHMNIAKAHPASIDPSGFGDRLANVEGEHWLAVHHVYADPAPVTMLCVLERAPGLNTRCKQMAANPLPLSPYILGLSVDQVRIRERFLLYADLVREANMVSLTADSGETPQRLADLIEHTLDAPSNMQP